MIQRRSQQKSRYCVYFIHVIHSAAHIPRTAHCTALRSRIDTEKYSHAPDFTGGCDEAQTDHVQQGCSKQIFSRGQRKAGKTIIITNGKEKAESLGDQRKLLASSNFHHINIIARIANRSFKFCSARLVTDTTINGREG